MQKIIKTPKPPYYAVIAPAILSDDITGYPEMALKVIEKANDIDGYLGIESCVQGNFIMSVTYWKSIESILEWKNNSHHVIAKENGRKKWFETYFTRIAQVERDY